MTVVRLTPRERAAVAYGRAERLIEGPDGNELLGDDLSSALARHLRHLHQAYHADDMDQLARTTRTIIVLADRVGLSHEARVAADVLRCCDGKDRNALAATLSRLTRLLDSVIGALKSVPSPF